jgi:outer membrane receptor protein involved in Fe transport
VRTFIVSLLSTALVWTATVAPAWSAPDAPPIEFHIDGGDATTTLTEFSRQAHLQLLFDYSVVKGHTTKALEGTYQPAEALQRLLANTDLEFDFVNERTLAVTQKKGPADVPVAPAEPKRGPSRRSRSRTTAPTLDGVNNPLDVIRITGSYVRDEPPVGDELISLTREDIETTGAATVADFLRTLPQAFGGGPNQDTHIGAEALTNSGLGVGVNLRGLGARATLVLINGRRVAPSGTEGEYVDIENIPLSAIERVDILPDSSSALFGADAVGGVVNFILRDKLDGGETVARGGSGTRGDLQEYLLSQTLGKSWDGGNGLISFEFYDRGALPAADRAYAVSDLTLFGGSNLDRVFSNPGNIVDPVTGRIWGIPAGQNGAHLSAADLLAGVPNLQGLYTTGRQIVPSQKRWTLFGSLRQGLGDRVTLFGEVLAGHREAAENFGSLGAYVMVPPSNPFYVNPTGRGGPVVVSYNFDKDLGSMTGQDGIDTLNVTAGVDFDVGSSWTVKSYASYVREKQNEVQTGELNSTALAVAVADPSPLTAFNPFGDGSNTNPATLQTLRTDNLFWLRSQLKTADITADGTLGELGGITFKVAVGADWRQELFYWAALTPGVVGTAPVTESSLSRTVVSSFGQLIAPIFDASNARPALRRLELSVAGRYENYTGFGSDTSPKYSLVWSPLGGVSLRGTWSRSERPPTLFDRDMSHNGVALLPVPNAAAPGGATPSLVWAGGNSTVRPERATSWTAGLDFAPLLVQGLSLGMTYFRTTFRDRIQATPYTPTVLSDSTYAAIVTRNPTAAQIDYVCNHSIFTQGTVAECMSAPVGAIVDLRVNNLAKLLTDGIDFNSHYERSTRGGDLAFALGGTWLHQFRQAQTPNQPLTSLLDTPNEPINLRLRATAGWQYRGWGAQVAGNFTNRYLDTASSPQRRVDSWTTIDVQLGYDFPDGATSWLRGLRVTLDARNVFNVAPPFLNNQVTDIGYDQENANPYGRQLSLQLRKRW